MSDTLTRFTLCAVEDVHLYSHMYYGKWIGSISQYFQPKQTTHLELIDENITSSCHNR